MAEEQQQQLGVGLDKEREEKPSTKTTMMTPWEQHSAVISIPRFDYNAPSSILNHSHSGFLITCTIKREKSATKEAMSILSKYIMSLSCSSSPSVETLDANTSLKRRKICFKEIGVECCNAIEKKESANSGVVLEEDTSSSSMIDANVDNGLLSLVKLTKSGLLLFTFPINSSPDTVDIVSNIFLSLDSGNKKPLQWCHRIFPIQATCKLNEETLHAVVSKLVRQFMDNKQNTFEKPIKFAVGYNRRGMEETEFKMQKYNSKESNLLALLDRNKCFGVVAGAVKEAIPDSIVDLKSPQISILLELLPLSRVPNGSLVVAVSVLPQSLVNTKPRLCMKPLVPDAKTTKCGT